MAKKIRRIPWINLEEWEHLLTLNAKVRWKGANRRVYDAVVLKCSGGNLRLRFEDGHESEPCYIENVVGVETDAEIIVLTRPGRVT